MSRLLVRSQCVRVVRAASFDEACRAVDAICAGGIPVLEITMTVPDALGVIREVVRKYGKRVLAGAGTVITATDAEKSIGAGAEFLVSPGVSPDVIRIADENGKLAMPGALTPTEIIFASNLGARVIKIFPCGSVGGPKYIQALSGPFPELRFIPTGGVSLANAADYIASGAFAIGAGTDLIDIHALRKGDSQKITASVKALVAAVHKARQGLSASSPSQAPQ